MLGVPEAAGGDKVCKGADAQALKHGVTAAAVESVADVVAADESTRVELAAYGEDVGNEFGSSREADADL